MVSKRKQKEVNEVNVGLNVGCTGGEERQRVVCLCMFMQSTRKARRKRV